ncbi:tetratricopeptide repeat protein [Planctomicrobium sp. SH527]|uniref:tetratricopeptide repeat protein n=1 Tax=Planctomicrobium sp. SH527 TaxID=3448123 RepID=UPI003F5BD7EC
MFARLSSFVLGTLLLAPMALAQNRSFPTVIGPTGRPYGPTQAEYQYQRRYGRPSPGSNGGGMEYVNGYPGGAVRGGYGYGGFGPGPFVPFAPYGGYGGYGGWGPQLFIGFDPFAYRGYDPAFSFPSSASYNSYYNYGGVFGRPFSPPVPPVLQPLPMNEFAPNPIPGGAPNLDGPFPTIAPTPAGLTPTSPKGMETSYQYQTQGDMQLQQLNYLAASERYKKSIDAARERADPRYRLAVTLAARSRFPEAVDQLKLATMIDPGFPQIADSLEDLYGVGNTLEKTRLMDRVSEWVMQDARDPNRLFLMGALLYLDGNPNSKTFLETAMLIAGKQQHLMAFTVQRSVPIPKPAAGQGMPVAAPAKPAAGPKPFSPLVPTPAATPTPAAVPKPAAPHNPLAIPPAPVLPNVPTPANKAPVEVAPTPAQPFSPLTVPENGETGPSLPPLK